LQQSIATNNKIILKVNIDFNRIDLRKVQFLYLFTNSITKFLNHNVNYPQADRDARLTGVGRNGLAEKKMPAPKNAKTNTQPFLLKREMYTNYAKTPL
jgi:hypothetical protein